MSRADSMAAIDAALQQEPIQPDTTTTLPDVVETPDMIAPPTIEETPTKEPLAKERKSAQQRIDAGEQDDIVAKYQEQSEETQYSALNTLKGVVKNTGMRIERLPTPGEIVFPLMVLAVFFFLLLPVNGHTRFVWIWLTLTGNAAIENSSGQPGFSTGGTGTGSSSGASADFSAQAPNGFSIVPLNNAPMMTGVEDL